MDRKKSFRIMFGLVLAFFVASLVTSRLFVMNTPRLNARYIGSLPRRAADFIASLMTAKVTPTIAPSTPIVTPLPPMPIIISSTAMPQAPDSQPQVTAKPLPSRTPTTKPPPTLPPVSSCPATSSQTYTTIKQNPNASGRLKFNVATNPETNVALRGYFEVQESTNLVSRNGDMTGLDPNMPPQISTLFTNHYPKIIKTYRINNWDYANNKPIPGESATPAWKVHVIGLQATPGEPLLGLKAGRTVDGSHVFLVMYANRNFIMLVHSNEDNWDETGPSGYPYYFMEICVDPNLLALYQKTSAEGRGELPGVAMGQVFGYAKSGEVKMTLRDTMSFMDPRYKEDWWEYGK